MRIVGNRVDHLTMRGRVALSLDFVAHLRARAEVARKHGRAAFEWGVRIPKLPGGHSAPERGKLQRAAGRDGRGVRLSWANEPHVTETEARRILMGELRFSRVERAWLITNEDVFQIRVDLHASGGDVGRKARAPRDAMSANLAKELDARDPNAEPGFTVEIVWRARELARRGLDYVIRESEAIFAAFGDVRETRIGRIDLCADVADFHFSLDDVPRLVKRPRAGWTPNWVDEEADDLDVEPVDQRDAHGHEAGRKTWVRADGPPSRERDERGRSKFVPPLEMRKPKLTGISIGRGGAVMCRIYDKREELSGAYDRKSESRDLEESIWLRNGWADDGPLPADARVTRIEFQLRGEALRELGIRDPDCMMRVVHDRVTHKPIGHEIAKVIDIRTGKERQARITDWLDSLWVTCLSWCRLVEPRLSRSGRPVENSRLELDARWKLLHEVRFTERQFATTLFRFRPRGAASAAQSLGVAISQAAREGQFPMEWEESAESYRARGVDAIALLRDRLHALKRDEAERCLEELLSKYHGDAPEALRHMAVRVNAARARWAMPGYVIVEPRERRAVSRDRTLATGWWEMPVSRVA
jgi:hypothetical protein